MIDELQFKLIRQKVPYQSTLRDHFNKLLSVDFLPFLRINKHQLTQVSLYGFDIYVEPLSAILQILNRIDGLKTSLLKFVINREQPKQWSQKIRDIWQSIKISWDQFIYQSTLYKISLNIYLLKQYLKVATKSLQKKDKQIIFTGCCNLFTQLLPILKKYKQIWLLCQCAQLNNELYHFHPSFNYSHFYSLLLPLHNQYEPIFKSIKTVAQKCLNICILTPFLFSLLRHRQAYHQFIQQADHQIWIPYLNALLFALIYNFKTRILQYEQTMEILQSTIYKLGILDHLQTNYFTAQLPNEWKEARDFFISALKVGYNAGELQTWHNTDFSSIQERILSYTKNSLLMHTSFPNDTPINLFFQNNFEKQLSDCLHELTGSLVNKSQLISNFSPNIADAVNINQKSVGGLLKLSHLLKLSNLTGNAHSLCYLLTFLIKIGNVNSQIESFRLNKIGQFYCTKAVKQIEKEVSNNRGDLKDVVFAYIKNHRPIYNADDIIRACVMISIHKQATLQILSIVQHENTINIESGNRLTQLAACNIVAFYVPETRSSQLTIKSFDIQYQIRSQVINLNSKLHSCLNVLVEQAVQKKNAKAMQILLWMVRICNWIVIPLLSFPVSSQYINNGPHKTLEQFSSCLIKSQSYHETLLQLLGLGLSISETLTKMFFAQVSLLSVCEQIIYQINTVINQLSQLQDNSRYTYIIQLLQLFIKVYRKSVVKGNKANPQLTHKTMKLYLRALEKLDEASASSQNQYHIKTIINSFSGLYCPLLDEIFNEQLSSRKWRTYMWKICLTSVDINVEHVNNIRDFELPSIQLGKGFLFHEVGQQRKDKQNTLSSQQSRARVQKLYEQAKNYQKPQFFCEDPNYYEQQEYLIRSFEIKQLQIDEKSELFCSKQYLLPHLSLKMISLLLSQCSQTLIMFMIDLLAMTPSNHKKLVQWSLLNNKKEVLEILSLSKQVVCNFLPQVLGTLSKQELQAMIVCLDENSKKVISDSFNFMLMMHQQGNAQPYKKWQLMINFSRSIGFLLVYNQSNWRYFNQLLCDVTFSKQSGLASIPSLILQYLQYIRITSNCNEDYELKIVNYYDLLQTYSNLLDQKHQFLKSLATPGTTQQNNKQTSMSTEQIRLFHINELSYISSFCQSWNTKQFLSRVSCFRFEVTRLTTNLRKFANVFETIGRTVLCFVKVNKVVNQLSRGSVMCPDFLNNMQMCSSEAYFTHKIHLGAHIETYYRTVGQNPKQVYCYLPTGEVKTGDKFFNAQLSQIQKYPQGSTFICSLKNSNQRTSFSIREKYESVKKQLITRKLIKQSKQIELIKDVSSQCSKQPENQETKLMFLFGLLYKAMQMSYQKVVKLSSLLECVQNRQMLSWELLKTLDVQTFHHIKSVQIDEQVSVAQRSYNHGN